MALTFVPDSSFSLSGITAFTFGMTEQCNMRCLYCCYSGAYMGLRTHSSTTMSRTTLDKAISLMCRTAHPAESISLSFYGGEALLCLDDIEYAVRELKEIFGSRISFDISTNGLLLTHDSVSRICRLPDTGISVSLDGCCSVHDRRRVGGDGSPTFAAIRQNLLDFKQSYPEEYRKRIRLMATFASLDELEEANGEYDAFSELLGDKPPHVSRVMPNFRTGEYLPDTMVQKKTALATALQKRREGREDFHTMLLDDLTRKRRRKFGRHTENGTIMLHTCLNTLGSIYVTADGKLYPCEKFGTRYSIGDVDSGIDHVLLRKVVMTYTLRRQMLCRDCDVAEYCARCPADMKISLTDMRRMCEDYRNDILNSIEFISDETGIQ